MEQISNKNMTKQTKVKSYVRKGKVVKSYNRENNYIKPALVGLGSAAIGGLALGGAYLLGRKTGNKKIVSSVVRNIDNIPINVHVQIPKAEPQIIQVNIPKQPQIIKLVGKRKTIINNAVNTVEEVLEKPLIKPEVSTIQTENITDAVIDVKKQTLPSDNQSFKTTQTRRRRQARVKTDSTNRKRTSKTKKVKIKTTPLNEQKYQRFFEAQPLDKLEKSIEKINQRYISLQNLAKKTKDKNEKAIIEQALSREGRLYDIAYDVRNTKNINAMGAFDDSEAKYGKSTWEKLQEKKEREAKGIFDEPKDYGETYYDEFKKYNKLITFNKIVLLCDL